MTNKAYSGKARPQSASMPPLPHLCDNSFSVAIGGSQVRDSVARPNKEPKTALCQYLSGIGAPRHGALRAYTIICEDYAVEVIHHSIEPVIIEVFRKGVKNRSRRVESKKDGASNSFAVNLKASLAIELVPMVSHVAMRDEMK
jgi:hypothetical protein